MSDKTFKKTLLLVDKVSKPLVAMSRNMAQFDEKLGHTAKQLEKFEKRTENLTKLGNKIKSVGQGLTVGVTLPVVAMGGAMIKAAADIEAMQQQLSAMLGSAQKGSEMFDEIKKMAATTPFETKDLMAATNTMLGFGISEKKVLPLMRQLGDISGGNAQRFQSLALAFSQVSSAGKLQGQDLLQMINAGFNPLEAIAKRTGKSVGYWKEMMSKGAVTVAMVEQAMKDATSEGGRFYNMMEKQSQTALGQWSTFQDNLNMLLADFGQIILPFAIKGLQKLSKTLEWFNSLSPNTKKLIIIISGIAAVIGPLLIIGGQLLVFLAALPKQLLLARIGFKVLTDGVSGFAKSLVWLFTNPIGLTILGIGALITVIVLLVKHWDKVKAAAINVGQAISTWWGGLVEKFKGWIGNMLEGLNQLIEKLGFLAYFIPGLGGIKLAKDIGNTIGGNRTNNDNRTFNSNSNNTSNIYNTTNNYNSMFPFTQAQYAT